MTGNRYPMPPNAIAARFPRIVRALRAAAILSHTEATGAIYMHQIGDAWAGEAVNHFGGIPALFRAAFRQDARNYARRYGPAISGGRT